jgi:hypothetical protein
MQSVDLSHEQILRVAQFSAEDLDEINLGAGSTTGSALPTRWRSCACTTAFLPNNR